MPPSKYTMLHIELESELIRTESSGDGKRPTTEIYISRELNQNILIGSTIANNKPNTYFYTICYISHPQYAF